MGDIDKKIIFAALRDFQFMDFFYQKLVCFLSVFLDNPDDGGNHADGEKLNGQPENFLNRVRSDRFCDKTVIQKEEKGDDDPGIENLADIKYAEQDDHACHGDQHGGKAVRKQGIENKLSPACDADKTGPAGMIPAFPEIDKPAGNRRDKEQLPDIDAPAGEQPGGKRGRRVEA